MSVRVDWILGGVVVVAMCAMTACGTPPVTVKRTPKPKQVDKSAVTAIDRMLSERQVKRMRLPGYQLIRESDEAVERMTRILGVIEQRQRTAAAKREYGRMRCEEGQIAKLRRLRDRAQVDAAGIEKELRRSDRGDAERLWLKVRMADMQARDFIYKRCTDAAHVEVQVIPPR